VDARLHFGNKMQTGQIPNSLSEARNLCIALRRSEYFSQLLGQGREQYAQDLGLVSGVSMKYYSFLQLSVIVHETPRANRKAYCWESR